MGQITRLAPGRRFCQVVVHGDTVYVAGQVAPKTVPSVKGQTQQILKEIDKALKSAGTNKSKLLMVNIWLSDIRTFDEMNEAWDAWVAKDHMPARATVEAKLAGAQFLVEIAVIAAR
jgi:enamine deaminase RidA (YjgF/YER057c/UK114 family)